MVGSGGGARVDPALVQRYSRSGPLAFSFSEGHLAYYLIPDWVPYALHLDHARQLHGRADFDRCVALMRANGVPEPTPTQPGLATPSPSSPPAAAHSTTATPTSAPPQVPASVPASVATPEAPSSASQRAAGGAGTPPPGGLNPQPTSHTPAASASGGDGALGPLASVAGPIVLAERYSGQPHGHVGSAPTYLPGEEPIDIAACAPPRLQPGQTGDAGIVSRDLATFTTERAPYWNAPGVPPVVRNYELGLFKSRRAPSRSPISWLGWPGARRSLLTTNAW